MTTWNTSGETRANICRKNEATSTSVSWPRYLWIALRNQVMSKRRARSRSPVRLVINTSWPFQTASNSALLIRVGRASLRRLNDGLVFPGLAEEEEAAIAQHRDRRLRGGGEPFPAALLDLGFEPEFLGIAEHFGDADLGHPHAMANLIGIGPDALEAQQRNQDLKSRIDGTGIFISGHSNWIQTAM